MKLNQIIHSILVHYQYMTCLTLETSVFLCEADVTALGFFHFFDPTFSIIKKIQMGRLIKNDLPLQKY